MLRRWSRGNQHVEQSMEGQTTATLLRKQAREPGEVWLREEAIGESSQG